MKKNWDQNKIKFYKFFFTGIKKPIIMEAYSRDQADEMLGLLPKKSGIEIDMDRLEDVRIEMPLTGVSERIRFGKKYIWVGLTKSVDGWMAENEFKKKIDSGQIKSQD